MPNSLWLFDLHISSKKATSGENDMLLAIDRPLRSKPMEAVVEFFIKFIADCVAPAFILHENGKKLVNQVMYVF